MARLPRIVVPGYPHHVTHRGNHGEDVFLSADGRQLYLEWLQQYSAAEGLAVLAYCLMTNHVHLIVIPERKESLSRVMGPLHGRHSQWVNLQLDRTGHLWGDRFYSVPMDEAHLWAAAKYVELNSVRAGLVARAEEYRWSSARAHVRNVLDPLLSNAWPPGAPRLGPEWGEWLTRGVDPQLLGALRRHTRTGYPLGSESFLATIEHKLGLKLPRRGAAGGRAGTVASP